LVLTAFCTFSLTTSIEKCQYSTLKQVTGVSFQVFLNSSLSDMNGQYDTNMNYTAEKVSSHPNQKLADVREFVCDYRRNTCSLYLMSDGLDKLFNNRCTYMLTVWTRTSNIFQHHCTGTECSEKHLVKCVTDCKGRNEAGEKLLENKSGGKITGKQAEGDKGTKEKMARKKGR